MIVYTNKYIGGLLTIAKMITIDTITTHKQAMDYINEKVNSLTKVSLINNYTYLKDLLEPDLDDSHRDFFLELVPKRGQICVNANEAFKRFKSVAEDADSSKIKRILERKNALIEGKFNSSIVGGITKSQTIYEITPEILKDCMISSGATNRFRIYYRFLEDVIYYHTTYERLYAEKIISMKDEKIDKLIENVDYLRKQNDFIIQQNVSLHCKVDSIFNMLISFMQATIPTWVGGSVMQNQN